MAADPSRGSLPELNDSARWLDSPLIRQAGPEVLSLALMNARNLDRHGFPEITRIARTVTGLTLTYGDFDQLDGRLDPLLHEALGVAPGVDS